MSSAAQAGLSHALALRRELSQRAQKYAEQYKLPAQFSYGEAPVVVFEPYDDGTRHGNFLPRTYEAIQKNPAWRKRLDKTHAQARSALPPCARGWKELDSCNSSDALLMNIFCYPGLFADGRVYSSLAVEANPFPEFGHKARVPLLNGRSDRTEVDMKLGNLLVESKLTESDFQTQIKSRAMVPHPRAPLLGVTVGGVESYRDFAEVFDRKALPQTRERYLSYQLIRNVLAAHATGCSFCLLCDARRPDLIEAWYAVMRCVQAADLRLRCKVLTWQELSQLVPPKLRDFLQDKYGIGP